VIVGVDHAVAEIAHLRISSGKKAEPDSNIEPRTGERRPLVISVNVAKKETEMTKCALVLGGGGPVGIAWETGVVLALAEEGVDLGNRVDHVIGTSAGAFVGARLALGHAPQAMAEPYQSTAEEAEALASQAPVKSAPPDSSGLQMLFQKIQDASRAGKSAPEIAREVAQFAREAPTAMNEEEFVARFTSSLGSPRGASWPARSFACTAFDVENGAFKIWNGADGENLVRAVASSCAVPGVFPAIAIGDRRYFDGGILSTTNAHLARGFDVVIVLAVTEILMRYSGFARDKKTPLQREADSLRESGSRVEIVALDTDALQALGVNFMDRSLQPAALCEGMRQGRAAAEAIRKSVPAFA
jgi:NTE family protein